MRRHSLPQRPRQHRHHATPGSTTGSPGTPGTHYQNHQTYQYPYYQKYYENPRWDYNQGYHDGLRHGTRDGRHEGLAQGRSEAYGVGYADGYAAGHRDGYAAGHRDGYAAGHADGALAGHEQGFGQGHEQGFGQGHEQGYSHGLDQGHNRGYDVGYEQGYTQGYDVGRDGQALPEGDSYGNTVYSHAGNTRDVCPETGRQGGPPGPDVLPDSLPTSPAPPTPNITYRTPIPPSAPLVRVPSEPDLRDLREIAARPCRPLSALARVHYTEVEVEVEAAAEPEEEAVKGDEEMHRESEKEQDRPEVPEPEQADQDHESVQPAQAVVPRPVQAVLPKRVQPVVPKLVQPVVPKLIQPVVPKPVKAVIPEPVQAVIPEPVQAVIPEPVQAVVPAQRVVPKPEQPVLEPIQAVLPKPIHAVVSVSAEQPVPKPDQEADKQDKSDQEAVASIEAKEHEPVKSIVPVQADQDEQPAPSELILEFPSSERQLEADEEADEEADGEPKNDADKPETEPDQDDKTVVPDPEQPVPSSELVQTDKDHESMPEHAQADHHESPSPALTTQTPLRSPSPPEQPAMVNLSAIFIFHSHGPRLSYPSALCFPGPPPANDPDAGQLLPQRSNYIAELYGEYQRRPRRSACSIYEAQPGQLGPLHDPMASLRAAAGRTSTSSSAAFPAVFPVTGCAPGLVPDHIVYKYAATAFQFARCVRHGLTTCPVCAITPSYSFLGPGEAIAGGHVFRPDGRLRPAEVEDGGGGGDDRVYPYPVGFGQRTAEEAELSDLQHPEEADPRRSLRFDPQLDPEVLGRHATAEDELRSEIGGDGGGLVDSWPSTFYCTACGGITWHVTKRRSSGEQPEPVHETEDKSSKAKTKGKNKGKDKKKTKKKDKEETTVHLLGMTHPSHHASYNEAWSSPSFASGSGSSSSGPGPGSSPGLFPEETGTTRSLFVQVAAVPMPKLDGLDGLEADNETHMLAAYFGPASSHNRCIVYDAATTATDYEGRLLRSLPYETLNANAPHIAAVACALHALWTRVLPSHRSAIDAVARWTSDHARRKAYRFRAVVVTASAYVADLFATQLDAKWTCHLKEYPQGEKGEKKAAVNQGGTKRKARKRKKKKGTRQVGEGKETERTEAEKEEAEAEKAETKESEEEGEPEAKEAERTEPEEPERMQPETEREEEPEKISPTSPPPDDPYDTKTPSSAGSPPHHFDHLPLHQHHHLNHLHHLHHLQGSPAWPHHDETPRVGRLVYADRRDLKRLLPNSALVLLVKRYIDLLRGHGVHVAFYYAAPDRQGQTSVEGARALAEAANAAEAMIMAQRGAVSP